MAVSFVPVPIPVDWTGKCRSWSSRGSPSSCVPSPSESMSWMRGAGPWDPTQDETWSRPRGAVLDGTLTLLKGEGGCWDSWMERAITPTLLGYEILDERAKFTVYKILVTGDGGDSWVIFRRFRDFCRLNDQLKELFPSLGLTLPPKRWFKDNYDEEFLHKRQIGLQTFLQNLTLNRDFSSSEAVRHFLCLVDPPSPFDSLEESRAFCETLEETNHRLQRELLENQREVDILKKNLEEKENYISLLVKKVKLLTLSSESIESSASVATNSNKHRAGGTEVNGFEQHQTDRNDGMDDRGYATLEINIQSACGARFCSEEFEGRNAQAQRRYNHGE